MLRVSNISKRYGDVTVLENVSFIANPGDGLGLIESALSRPKNLLLYNHPDLFSLAAAYGFGLAQNHGFIDGNKRTAYVVTRLFLILNSHDIYASSVEKVITFEKVGKGEVDQSALASWLRSHSINHLV